MKKNAVMLADTRPALVGQMLVQLRKTSQDVFDEVIVFDCGLSKSDKEIMAGIMPCRFLPYVSPLSDILLKSERFQRFSLIMFARYEMFRLLKEYSAIVWIDTDMVIQGSLLELLQETEGYGFSILCEDPYNKSSKNVDHMRTNFFEPVVGYDMNAYLYCTGLIVVRDCLDQVVDYTEWCYNKTIEWADNLNLPDQGVLNALTQEFGFPVKPLGHNGRYGCFPYIGRDCHNALLVHCWGTNKFWNNYYLNKKFPAWEDCYQRWLELGGSELLRPAAPEVSVIIPVYKPDFGYFRQCLDSLQAQMKNSYESYSDFEIIIVAEPFMQTELQTFIAEYDDPRIKLEFNKERLGIAASLNRGMRLAQGKYIARIDDDDIASLDRLAKQAEYLNIHENIELCTSDYMYFGDMNEGRRVFEGEMSRAWSALTCPFDHPTIMFRRDFFVNNDLFYDETRGYVEDWELWQRAFKHGMRVGCIGEILFYHRWHSGSAGQTNKTVYMMRQMIKTNMLELNVEVPDDDLCLLSPWNGKLEDETQRQKLAKYFDDALKNNKKQRIYEQRCLQKVFELRLFEAETGSLSELVIERTDFKDQNAVVWRPVETRGIKGIVKKLLKPFYRPFRHRYEDRLIEIQSSSWRNEGHLLNCIEKLDRIVAGQQEQIRHLRESLDFLRLETQSVISAKIYEQAENIRQEFSEKLFTEAENTRQGLSAKMFAEAENTRQGLSAKMFAEAENTRQELSGKMFTEAENTRQELSGKMFAEAENTRSFTENKIWQAVERVNTVGDHVYDVSQELRFQRNLMQAEQSGRTKLFLLGTPEHSNIGDAAITLGERAFLHKYFPGYSIVELSTYDFESWYGKIANMIEADDLIFLQGGGNLGNRFLPEERVRRRVIGDFPNNKIIIMPQTIYFDDNEAGWQELTLSRKVYNRHKHLTIFTRGLQSKAFAENNFSTAKVINSLDMALMLDYGFNLPRKGALLCLRDLDDESGLDAASYGEVVNTVENCFAEYVRTNNLYNGDVEANILRDMRQEVVTAELMKFAASRVVVTDRLHGLIFAIITHTPCVVISAFNQKIAEFCEFFADSNGVFFIDKNIDMLSESIEKALQVGDVDYPILRSGFFDKVYEAIR